jgi:hypothetical protein
MVNRIQKRLNDVRADQLTVICWITASVAVGLATNNVWFGIATCAALAAILGAIDAASDKIIDAQKK